MRFMTKLAGPLAGLALGLAATTAAAAPTGSGLGGLKTDAAAASAVEKTYWTVRCHYHRGYKHCNRIWVTPYVIAPPVLFYGSRHYGPRRYGYYGHRRYR
ncbi:MAG: hypothetical protein ACKVP7_03375 [Hyphomicrobiaceae bacterium]